MIECVFNKDTFRCAAGRCLANLEYDLKINFSYFLI